MWITFLIFVNTGKIFSFLLKLFKIEEKTRDVLKDLEYFDNEIICIVVNQLAN